MSARSSLPRYRSLPSLVFLLLLFSCARVRSVDIAAFGPDGAAVAFFAADDRSAAALLGLDKERTLRFSFASPLALPSGSALELEYTMDESASGLLVVFRAAGEDAWALPPTTSASASQSPRVIRYRFPLVAPTLSAFELSAEFPADANKQDKKKQSAGNADGVSPAFRLKSLRLVARAYGYAEEEEALFLTPYVYREKTEGGSKLIVDPPVHHRPVGSFDLRLGLGEGRTTIAAGETVFAYASSRSVASSEIVTVPAGALSAEPFPLAIEGGTDPSFLLTEPRAAASFPEEALSADPGLILAFRQDAWRDARYEVFRWARFPSVLIFDTADYGVQDNLFKRIAFFTEKAGFRGRLATDDEIASLHGWNAHDYRAESLAAFYETARRTAFPLNAEERELFLILTANGIVKKAEDGSVAAGDGAIVSISRESEGYLRSLFMTHEAYHGLFFIDDDFRRFAASRWDNLDPVGRRFLKAYFDMHRYDVADRYLMTNELMAYCLQQPASGAAKYFGEILASRLEKDAYRKQALPPKDEASRSWPELARLFSEEAMAFDAYVRGRWGLR